MMKRIALTFCLLMVFAAVASAQPSRTSTNASMAGAGMQDKKTLYARLGGYDAVAAVVDDFVGRLATDKKLGRFFVGHSKDSLNKIRQHVIDQICSATGGPCVYTGRDMKTSHQGLGISGEEWDLAAGHLVETLNKFKVPKTEQDELLAIVSSLRKDIVEK